MPPVTVIGRPGTRLCISGGGVHDGHAAMRLMRSVPAQVKGGRRFLDEPEVRDLLARFDRLQSLERQGAFASGRLTAADTTDADSFKVRRGKVGGFADYFDAEQQQRLEELVRRYATGNDSGVAPSRA